eukprot:82784-Amorphochlora_amoeboformis.AAC.2
MSQSIGSRDPWSPLACGFRDTKRRKDIKLINHRLSEPTTSERRRMDVAGLLTYLKMTSRGDVIDKALDITLSLTNQKNFQVSWGKVPGATHQLVVLACAREGKGGQVFDNSKTVQFLTCY